MKATTYLFEKMPVHKAVFSLIIPTVLSSLVTILYSLADTFFVGILNDQIQTSAVALAAPALLAFNAVNNLFGIGSSSMMSRALGQNDIDTVKRSSSWGFYGSAISGAAISCAAFAFLVPFTKLLGATPENLDATMSYMRYTVICGAAPSILNVVFAYLVRSEGNSLHASIGTMSGCLLNIVLDPIFILPRGLGMGAAGAGLATFISNCAACVYFFVFIFVKRENTNIRLNIRYLSFKKEIIKGIVGVGVPASIQNLLNVIGMTILNNFVSGYGTAAVAAIGIAQKIHTVPVQIMLGTTQGVMPLVGYTYSARMPERFKRTLNFLRNMMFPFTLVLCAFCFVFSEELVGFFIDNKEVILYGKMFLRGQVIALPFMFLDFTAVAVFQSVGFGRKSLLFAILRKVVLEIPAIFVLNAIFHASGVAFAALVSESVLAVYGTVLLQKIIKKVRIEAS